MKTNNLQGFCVCASDLIRYVSMRSKNSYQLLIFIFYFNKNIIKNFILIFYYLSLYLNVTIKKLFSLLQKDGPQDGPHLTQKKGDGPHVGPHLFAGDSI
jgi:hypothetical protein